MASILIIGLWLGTSLSYVGFKVNQFLEFMDHFYYVVASTKYYYLFLCLKNMFLSLQQLTGWAGIRAWCLAWWHSGRDDYDEDLEDPSDMGYATPVSIETPLQSSVSRYFVNSIY